eukprot:1138463-Pelagomonas_calceolata.AAC.2
MHAGGTVQPVAYGEPVCCSSKRGPAQSRAAFGPQQIMHRVRLSRTYIALHILGCFWFQARNAQSQAA